MYVYVSFEIYVCVKVELLYPLYLLIALHLMNLLPKVLISFVWASVRARVFIPKNYSLQCCKITSNVVVQIGQLQM